MLKLKTEAEMRETRKKATKETSVEDHFVRTAKKYKCVQRKLTQYYAEDGWPDRLCVWPDGQGTTDWIELKRPVGGKLEPRQPVIMGRLRACGATVLVLHTKALIDEYFRLRADQLLG